MTPEVVGRLPLALAALALLTACTTPGTSASAAASARAHTELAAAYYQSAQYATAAAEAQTALQADPAYAPAYNVHGLVLMATGQLKDAQVALDRAIALDPHDADARNNRAVLLCRSGRVDEALRDWDIAAHAPYYATPQQSASNAAACLAGAGRASEAQVWRDRAAAASPAAAIMRPSDLTANGVGPNVAR